MLIAFETRPCQGTCQNMFKTAAFAKTKMFFCRDSDGILSQLTYFYRTFPGKVLGHVPQPKVGWEPALGGIVKTNHPALPSA